VAAHSVCAQVRQSMCPREQTRKFIIVFLISRTQNLIVWQYGHPDLASTAAVYLSTPDRMDFLPFEGAMGDPVIRSVVQRTR
jgi:hypothetical protein